MHDADRQTERQGLPVLTEVTEGVLVHQSEFLQSNAVVVQGLTGVLLIDAGITDDEMTRLGDALSESHSPLPVEAAAVTAPHNGAWMAARSAGEAAILLQGRQRLAPSLEGALNDDAGGMRDPRHPGRTPPQRAGSDR